MGVAIITDLNLSSANLGQVEFVEEVDLEALTVTRGATSDNQVPFYVAYTPAKTNQKGVTWSVSGSSYVAIDASTGVLTIKEGASNAKITVKATSTVNTGISATLETTVSYADTPIQFASADVKAALLATFDTDGDGEISKTEAAAKALTTELSSITTEFTFHEFQYFTGTTVLNMRNTKVSEITMPASLTSVGQGQFESNKNLKKVKFQEGLKSLDTVAIRSNTSLVLIDFPTTLTDIGYCGFSMSASGAVAIFRATTPPNYVSAYASMMPSDGKIYVPDASVDAYKAATGWSLVASLIYPLSEYEG